MKSDQKIFLLKTPKNSLTSAENGKERIDIDKVSLSYKNRDTSFLVINLLIYRIFTRFPMLFSETSGNAAALCSLYSGIVAFGLIIILFVIFSKKPGMNLIDAAQSAFGAMGRYTVSIIVLLYLAISAFVALGEFSHLSKLISFPTAPGLFVAAFLVVGSIFAALGGFKTILRLHGIFVPLILAAVTLLVASTIYKGNIFNLFPLLGTSTQELFGNGLSGIIIYTDIVLLFLITPETKNCKQTTKTVFWSSGFSVLIIFLFVLAFSLSVPYSTSSGNHSPIYLLLKEVYYGRFFQRIDAIILFVSSISGMLYLALNIFLFCNLLKQAFRISNVRSAVLIYSLVILAAAMSSGLIPSNILTSLIFICGFSVLFVVLLSLLFAKRRVAIDESE